MRGVGLGRVRVLKFQVRAGISGIEKSTFFSFSAKPYYICAIDTVSYTIIRVLRAEKFSLQNHESYLAVFNPEV